MLLSKYAGLEDTPSNRDLTLKEKSYIERNYPEYEDREVRNARNVSTLLGGATGIGLGAATASIANKKRVAPLVGAGVGGILGGIGGRKFGGGMASKAQEEANAKRAEEMALLTGVSVDEANDYIRDAEDQARYEAEMELQSERLGLERENMLTNKIRLQNEL